MGIARSVFCLSALFFVSAGCGKKDESEAPVGRQPGEAKPPELGMRDACSKTAKLTAENQRFTTSEVSSAPIFHFQHLGIPLCSSHGREASLGEQGEIASLGARLDDVHFTVATNVIWPRQADVEALVIKTGNLLQQATALEAMRCWHIAPNNELVPALDLSMADDRTSVRAIADGSQVFEIGSGGFDMNGKVSTQSEGIAPSATAISLDSFDESGFLQGKNFLTSVLGGKARANAPDRQFLYPLDDERFDEAALYANAEITLQWFKALGEGVIDDECFPIALKVHFEFRDGPNNADYQNVTKTPSGRPEIRVGDGDGKLLKGLARDPDVVGHELGHHVVFRGIRETSDKESVVIHEALADFFVYSRTGNACLGESICPTGSPACWIADRCLRTGENDLKFTDAKLPIEVHSRSQFLSAMLWELSNAPGTDRLDFTKTVAASIKYLLPRSSYADLIAALMLADRDRHGGENACAIYNAAVGRGLQERLTAYRCESFKKIP